MATTVPAGLLRTLATLRWVAVGGQSLVVLLAVHLLGLPLQSAPLWGGIAALALFNVWAWHRARRLAEATQGEALLHVLVDLANLAWMIAWSGGAMNPFASLFLLPLALVAVAMPWRAVLAVMLACAAGYAVSTVFGRPLPHMHGVFGDTLDLHLWGMAVNFVVSGAVVTGFLTRLAQTLREREQELARLREQFARREGIVALATHAAAVAHELNTPLGTLTLMVEDVLADAPAGSVQQADAQLMAQLLDECRDRVRQLAQPADDSLAQPRLLRGVLDQLVERWQLLRPAIQLDRQEQLPADVVVNWDAGIGHLLQALLNNAADASQAAGSAQVELEMEWTDGLLRGCVRDFGRGVSAGENLLPGRLFQSSKPDGLGVGLVLSHATVERLGGRLAVGSAGTFGASVRFELPLASVAGA
ncbi:two-component system sensor histidine kinase RegB [Tahibacter aquaticus]|uniref:histidine kinase n=1 Tax=Tahibacter aquaticus TaxID=520092 RepID=A0A4R6YU43_9GAMM|nr:ATP-binding protein [Tahibacter aquaticus]TDR41968.1 two-component system sensor histidine kinase RegB [Tahibacter aquaticus]